MFETRALFEQFRPTTLDEVVGQSKAIEQIKRVLARGWGGRAWWITGLSGTGKTTIARAIASEGCVELGIEEIDSQCLTPAKIREIEREMQYRMLGERPGRCYIVNEAHGLRKDTIRQLLVTLERLPGYCVWIFTTTKSGEAKLFEDDDSGDAAPLLSRCVEISLACDDVTKSAFAKRAREIAQAEGIDGLPLCVYEHAMSASRGNFRRVLQRIEAGTFKVDAVEVLEREYSFIKSTKGDRAEKQRAELLSAIALCKGV